MCTQTCIQYILKAYHLEEFAMWMEMCTRGTYPHMGCPLQAHLQLQCGDEVATGSQGKNQLTRPFLNQETIRNVNYIYVNKNTQSQALQSDEDDNTDPFPNKMTSNYSTLRQSVYVHVHVHIYYVRHILLIVLNII